MDNMTLNDLQEDIITEYKAKQAKCKKIIKDTFDIIKAKENITIEKEIHDDFLQNSILFPEYQKGEALTKYIDNFHTNSDKNIRTLNGECQQLEHLMQNSYSKNDNTKYQACINNIENFIIFYGTHKNIILSHYFPKPSTLNTHTILNEHIIENSFNTIERDNILETYLNDHLNMYNDTLAICNIEYLSKMSTEEIEEIKKSNSNFTNRSINKDKITKGKNSQSSQFTINHKKENKNKVISTHSL